MVVVFSHSGEPNIFRSMRRLVVMLTGALLVAVSGCALCDALIGTPLSESAEKRQRYERLQKEMREWQEYRSENSRATIPPTAPTRSY